MSQAVPYKMFFQRSFLMMHCVFNEMKFDHGITVCYICQHWESKKARYTEVHMPKKGEMRW